MRAPQHASTGPRNPVSRPWRNAPPRYRTHRFLRTFERPFWVTAGSCLLSLGNTDAELRTSAWRSSPRQRFHQGPPLRFSAFERLPIANSASGNPGWRTLRRRAICTRTQPMPPVSVVFEPTYSLAEASTIERSRKPMFSFVQTHEMHSLTSSVVSPTCARTSSMLPYAMLTRPSAWMDA